MSDVNNSHPPIDQIIANAQQRAGSNLHEGTTSDNDGNRYPRGRNTPQEGRETKDLDHNR